MKLFSKLVSGLALLVMPPLMPQQGIRPMPIETTYVDVLFSPNGGITSRIVGEIDCSKRTVYVQAYSFTSRPVLEALIRAHGRGVRVEVCADNSNGNAMN